MLLCVLHLLVLHCSRLKPHVVPMGAPSRELLEVASVFLRDFGGLEWFGVLWGGVGGFGLALGWL